MKKEKEEFCKQGKISAQACIISTTQAQATTDSPLTMPEDMKASFKARNALKE